MFCEDKVNGSDSLVMDGTHGSHREENTIHQPEGRPEDANYLGKVQVGRITVGFAENIRQIRVPAMCDLDCIVQRGHICRSGSMVHQGCPKTDPILASAIVVMHSKRLQVAMLVQTSIHGISA
jgi:hypothetical protein